MPRVHKLCVCHACMQGFSSIQFHAWVPLRCQWLDCSCLPADRLLVAIWTAASGLQTVHVRTRSCLRVRSCELGGSHEYHARALDCTHCNTASSCFRTSCNLSTLTHVTDCMARASHAGSSHIGDCGWQDNNFSVYTAPHPSGESHARSALVGAALHCALSLSISVAKQHACALAPRPRS